MSKYRNVRYKGYASKKEADRAAQLEILQKLGEVKDLQYQVKFELVPKQDGERAVTYTVDFLYKDRAGNVIAEDAKGFKTQQYVIRRKLMLWRHGIKVLES